MDFNQQSFGSLLFSLENEYLKKEIRNIEKINKLLIHIKFGIIFSYPTFVTNPVGPMTVKSCKPVQPVTAF